MPKVAIVLGASGLVGNELVQQLLADANYRSIAVFVRKELPIKHSKLTQQITDFDHLEKHAEQIKGDVVFCCLGTTIKVAGSQEAFTKVDYHYPLKFAKIAKQNGVPKYILVSSIGANSETSNFYLNIKGSLEKQLQKLNFNALIAVRPSMLLGDRKEFRLGEVIGKIFMKLLGLILIGKLKRYKGIEARTVAKAMIKLAQSDSSSFEIIQSEKLQAIGK